MQKIRDFLNNIHRRINLHPNICTLFEILSVMAIIPLIKTAEPSLFAENGVVENIQLLVLMSAFLIAVFSSNQRRLFVFFGLMIMLMIMRETNMFRRYFCEKYLSPHEMCRWSSFKYGYLATDGRLIFIVAAIWYFIKNKLWQPLWKYIIKAPIYLWDIIIVILMTIGGTVAEFACIDNEILEEYCELICYIAIANCIWRYRQIKL